MKLSYLTIGEEKYPICFSSATIEDIQDEFGGLTEWQEALQTGKLKVYTKTIEIFMNAGREYCITSGIECPPPLTGRISARIDMEGIQDCMAKVMECMAKDSERSVEVRSKN